MNDWRASVMTVVLYATAGALAVASAWLLAMSGRRLVIG